MTPEKLKANLQKLKDKIARKPSVYTAEYASTISESFEKYTRTSNLNVIVSLNEILIEFDWPFPNYTLGNKTTQRKAILILIIMMSPEMIKQRIMFWKTNMNGKDEKWIKKHLDKFMYRHFNLSKKEIFSSWKSNPILSGKHYIIDSIHKTYSKGYWYSCIVSTFPLLDFLCRKYFNAKKFDRDMTYIVSMFQKAEITSRDTMPGHVAWEVAEEKGENVQEATEKDLRLVGVALSSFLNFADIYYAFHRNDDVNSAETINRHAIIHGADNQDIWTRENATKILIFLDLTLSLEPVFDILLNEK